MLKHIIFFKSINENPYEKQLELTELESKLKTMASEMDFLLKLEVGKNVVVKPISFDICLNIELNSLDDLERYRIHPAHQRLIEFIHEKKFEKAVVDYFA